jgi:hypothetical protein
MTTASFNYVAALYESAVDSGLDVQAIRLFLAEHGIRRTPAQVVYDLDTVFEFTDYADSHPAPARQTVKQFDASMSAKQVRLFNEEWEANRVRQ